ncbi:MAG: purine-nucleoside phosphorylase [Anaerolineales bacterium]|nr:purine-nucleoside phosphorylase [Anaerolineales bacterium]
MYNSVVATRSGKTPSVKSSPAFADIQRAAEFVRKRIRIQPEIAIILGSGSGSLADSIEAPTAVPYARIPGWPVSTVKGHAGTLVAGTLAGKSVAVMQGRVHFFEGYTAEQTAFPVRVLRRMGVNVFIITNAAGAIHPDFQPGDLMLITDHINLLGLGGANPLRGPNDERLGPRFPDVSRAYDRELQEAAWRAAAETGLFLRQGVYAGVAGPSFETPAELRFLRGIGADAVGMSTVSEVVAARHGGMRVLGVSVISNRANLDGSHPAEHEEVLRATQAAVPKLSRLIESILRSLA